MRIKRKTEEKPRIELVPMIDTMAFLLIFFMVASLAMSQQAGLPVGLPKAEAAASQTWGDRALVITLDKSGAVFLNKEAVTLTSLRERITARLEKKPDLIVVINADAKVRHGLVVQAMDAAKQAGAAKMAIATQPEGRQAAAEQ